MQRRLVAALSRRCQSVAVDAAVEAAAAAGVEVWSSCWVCMRSCACKATLTNDR